MYNLYGDKNFYNKMKRRDYVHVLREQETNQTKKGKQADKDNLGFFV